MMKNKSSKAVRFAILLCAVLCPCIPPQAEEYQSAHRVNPGDTMSADMLNELFSEIEAARKTVMADDLIGTWKGGSYCPKFASAPGWFFSDVHQCLALTNVTVTITKPAEDYYQVGCNAPDPFWSGGTGFRTNRIGVLAGMLLGMPSPYTIDKISKTRIRLTSHNIYDEHTRLVILDRVDIPPKKPTLISTDVSNKEVVLTWQDGSDDETGFNILRRDRLSGDYSNVCTLAANTTCWTNTVPSSGFYWYRITATNSCGASLGSNVKRVVVP